MPDPELRETTSCLIIHFELADGEEEPLYGGPSPKDMEEAAALF